MTDNLTMMALSGFSDTTVQAALFDVCHFLYVCSSELLVAIRLLPLVSPGYDLDMKRPVFRWNMKINGSSSVTLRNSPFTRLCFRTAFSYGVFVRRAVRSNK